MKEVRGDGLDRLDAIEFNEELATIDTLYDLAFLLMDLDIRGQRRVAYTVLNRYLWRSGADLDLRGLEALPLFLRLRAAIRALVTAERVQQESVEVAAGERRIAHDYFKSANIYLDPPAPRLMVVGGLSGTGKSTLARALAPELGPAPGAVHLRSDLERKRLYGVAETARLKPEAYTQASSAAVYAVLYATARKILAARHAVIVECSICQIDGAGNDRGRRGRAWSSLSGSLARGLSRATHQSRGNPYR